MKHLFINKRNTIAAKTAELQECNGRIAQFGDAVNASRRGMPADPNCETVACAQAWQNQHENEHRAMQLMQEIVTLNNDEIRSQGGVLQAIAVPLTIPQLQARDRAAWADEVRVAAAAPNVVGRAGDDGAASAAQGRGKEMHDLTQREFVTEVSVADPPVANPSPNFVRGRVNGLPNTTNSCFLNSMFQMLASISRLDITSC